MSENADSAGAAAKYVALELMNKISGEDLSSVEQRTSNARQYYLDLYAECLQVAWGLKTSQKK